MPKTPTGAVRPPWPRVLPIGFEMGDIVIKRTMAILAIVALLAGCGPDIYQKAATSQDQFGRDQASCQKYAMEQPPAEVTEESVPPAPVTLANSAKVQADIRSCMVAKGYTLEPKGM